jgi:hypothetical protein
VSAGGTAPPTPAGGAAPDAPAGGAAPDLSAGDAAPGTSAGAAASPAAGGARSRMARRLALAIVAVSVLVLSALLIGPGDGDPPLDPDSTEEDGLRGLVELLEQVDVRVEVSLALPEDPETVVFVPVDRLNEERREELGDWVEGGGRLVVGGVDSPLHELQPGEQGPATAFGGATGAEPECEVLDVVDEVVQATWIGLEVPSEGDACFPIGEESAWLVTREVGDGELTALGSAEPFTNGRLDEADNVVLAAALLAPAPGERLQIVPRPPPEERDIGPLDLIGTQVWVAIGVGVAALLLLVLWRARRLGQPVAEQLPPVVPSAELARSVAGLLQRADDRDAAADRLRAGVRRDVAYGLGTGPDEDPRRLVELLVDRTDVAREDAERALLDGHVDTDDTLIAVAAAAGRSRAALRHPPGG